MRSYKSLYKAALEAAPLRLHFAAHSHHPWPNATREAQLQFWDDSARFLDEKWEKRIFGEVLPEAKRFLIRHLRLPVQTQIAVAQSSHELAYRLLSCFPLSQKFRVLTTDSEFYSFSRQLARLEEEGLCSVERIPVEPFNTFPARFTDRARSGQFNLAFVSHTFFNSGYVFRELETLAAETPEQTWIAIDGYHAFGAIPVDLSQIGQRIFYLAGGYKYAQAGEGACFMTLPARANELKPRDTGWFAGFGSLTGAPGKSVEFPSDWQRFAGSTFDPSAWYRFNAVMRLWEYEGIDVELIHARAQILQRRFLDRLAEHAPARLSTEMRVVTGRDLDRQGNFLTFALADAARIQQALMRQEVITDSRGTRLRFGFGLYHDLADVERLLEKLAVSAD